MSLSKYFSTTAYLVMLNKGLLHL